MSGFAVAPTQLEAICGLGPVVVLVRFVRVPFWSFCLCGPCCCLPCVSSTLFLRNKTHASLLPLVHGTEAYEVECIYHHNPSLAAEKVGSVANLGVILVAVPLVTARIGENNASMAALVAVAAAVPVPPGEGRGSEVNPVAVHIAEILSLVDHHDSRTVGTVVSAAGMAPDLCAGAPRMAPAAGYTSHGSIDFDCVGDMGARHRRQIVLVFCHRANPRRSHIWHCAQMAHCFPLC